MCNKRPLHQPASSSYCGSTHREPGNPSNHGRAEKAGAYSSLPFFQGFHLLLGLLCQNSSQCCQAVSSARALAGEEAVGKDPSLPSATSQH